MALGKKMKKQKTKINQKTVIHRREFENKLTKELLKIVHDNLQTSVRLSLFSTDVTVDFQFLIGRLFHKPAALTGTDMMSAVCMIVYSGQL